MLISPFTSLKDAVKSLLGSLTSIFVRERFENIELIKQIESPILIIHGKKDTVVPCEHSIQLKEMCGSRAKLVLPALMSHNEYTIKSDIIAPLAEFFTEVGLDPGSPTRYPVTPLQNSWTLPPAVILNAAHKKD